MKRFLLYLIGIFSFVHTIGQNKQTIGTPNTLVVSKGGLTSDSGLITPKGDTTNAAYKDSLGSLRYFNGNYYATFPNEGHNKWVPFSFGTPPAGSNTNIQYNNAGSFAGSNKLTWNNTVSQLQVMGTKGIGSNPMLYLQDTITATIGTPAQETFLSLGQLDRSLSTVAFGFAGSDNKYSGVDTIHRVMNYGWNLNAGGGVVVAGLTGIGHGIEWHYQPVSPGGSTDEMHDLYLDYHNVQHRLASYTINNQTGDYDFFHTVSRLYIKRPSDNTQYFQTYFGSGIASMILYGNSRGTAQINTFIDTVGDQAGIQISGLSNASECLISTPYAMRLNSGGNTIFRVTPSAGIMYADLAPIADHTYRCGLEPSNRWSQVNAMIGEFDTEVATPLLFSGKAAIATLGVPPTAYLQIGAGTATATTAPLKFTAGTNLTTPEAGTVEYNGTNIYSTPNTTLGRWPIRNNSLQYTTPATGSTIVAVAQIALMVCNPSGALVALTVTFPASPVNGQTFGLAISQIITTLTLQTSDGSTIDGTITTSSVNSNGGWVYSSTANTWFKTN